MRKQFFYRREAKMSFTRTGATALVLWLTLLSMVSAQQGTLSIENAKKEAEVVWYGTLTGGSIVGRITGAFESKYPFMKVKYLRLGGADGMEGSFGAQVEREKNRPPRRSLSMVRRHGCLYGRQSGPRVYEGSRRTRAANPGGLYQYCESIGGGRVSGGDHPGPPHRRCQIKRSAGRLVGGCQPCRSQHSSHRHLREGSASCGG